MEKDRKSKISLLSYSQKLVVGFAVIIAVGTVLLMLPISTKEGESTSFVNALFTSTSAACVTGLVTYDTFTHWTRFGQIVILLLIQMGGLGFMSFAVIGAILTKRKISLKQRELMQEAINVNQLGGIVRLFKIILKGTLICECAGAVLLAVRFIPMLGPAEGIYYAIFHSISAFCNAGFDLMGRYEEYSSFTSFVDDPYVNIVIMLLIIIGGIGFYVWDDILKNRFRFSRFSLHTKIVLVTTAVIIFFPAVLFFCFERTHAFSGLGIGDSVVASFFQSVTLRTAGFNTVDQSELSGSSLLMCNILMLIGGSPGSTAGGIKTTTIAVLFLSTLSELRNHKSVTVFERRLEDDLLRRVIAILFVYCAMEFAGTMAVSQLENMAVEYASFGVFSAVSTVGLFIGTVGSLSTASRVILIFLMFFGRIGGLSMAMAFTKPYINPPLQYPAEKISVG